jgi:hypothetical protein
MAFQGNEISGTLAPGLAPGKPTRNSEGARPLRSPNQLVWVCFFRTPSAQLFVDGHLMIACTSHPESPLWLQPHLRWQRCRPSLPPRPCPWKKLFERSGPPGIREDGRSIRSSWSTCWPRAKVTMSGGPMRWRNWLEKTLGTVRKLDVLLEAALLHLPPKEVALIGAHRKRTPLPDPESSIHLRR